MDQNPAVPASLENSPGEGKAASVLNLPNLSPSVDSSLTQSIDLLKDVPLRVTVELGRAQLLIRDVLGLRNGSVVELDRQAGAAVDILVNGVLIAKGEVVVVDERFGVRITEVVSAPQIPVG